MRNNEINPAAIGESIKKLRYQYKLSQSELASKLYISPKAVSRWELGYSVPDLESIIRICKTFDISPTELITGDKVNEKNIVEAFNKNLNYTYNHLLTNAKILKYIKMSIKFIILTVLTLIITETYDISKDNIYEKTHQANFNELTINIEKSKNYSQLDIDNAITSLKNFIKNNYYERKILKIEYKEKFQSSINYLEKELSISNNKLIILKEISEDKNEILTINYYTLVKEKDNNWKVKYIQNSLPKYDI